MLFRSCLHFIHQVRKGSMTHAEVPSKVGIIPAWHNVIKERCTSRLSPESSFNSISLEETKCHRNGHAQDRFLHKAIIALSRLCTAVIHHLLARATRSLLEHSQTITISGSCYSILKLGFRNRVHSPCEHKLCPTRIQSGLVYPD